MNIADVLYMALLRDAPGLFGMRRQQLASAQGPQPVYELLSSFSNGKGGFLPMPEVVAAVRALGLQGAWDRAVISYALHYLQEHQEHTVSVNLHGTSFLDLALLPGVARLIATNRCWVELLEDDSSLSSPLTQSALSAAAASGAALFVDDFGTGQSASSLASLRPFLKGVKLAGELLRLDEGSEHPICPGLIQSLKSQGAVVIVEQVETAGQAKLALDAGADFIQGYAVAMPEPAPLFRASCLH